MWWLSFHVDNKGRYFTLLAMEQWEPVVGFEDHYIVSSEGRVRRIGKDRMGRCRNTMLRSSDRNGYRGVTFCVEGKTTTVSVHRIMWEAFRAPIPPSMQINHINGDKTDNRLANLEVCTARQNMSHMRLVLKRRQVTPPPMPGERNPNAKLEASDVHAIRTRIAQGDSPTKIARDFSVNRSLIHKIRRKEAWAHLEPTPPIS
jgi:hypothetical protein